MGYDTVWGRGADDSPADSASGLSIARVLLRDPEVLVLDEATSAIDTQTQLLIQRSLDRVTDDRTTFAIAHRLSTVRSADLVLVLEDGTIVERGTHEELLGREGLYSRLWKVQVGQVDDLPPEFIERIATRADEPRT